MCVIGQMKFKYCGRKKKPSKFPNPGFYKGSSVSIDLLIEVSRQISCVCHISKITVIKIFHTRKAQKKKQSHWQWFSSTVKFAEDRKSEIFILSNPKNTKYFPWNLPHDHDPRHPTRRHMMPNVPILIMFLFTIYARCHLPQFFSVTLLFSLYR